MVDKKYYYIPWVVGPDSKWELRFVDYSIAESVNFEVKELNKLDYSVYPVSFFSYYGCEAMRNYLNDKNTVKV